MRGQERQHQGAVRQTLVLSDTGEGARYVDLRTGPREQSTHEKCISMAGRATGLHSGNDRRQPVDWHQPWFMPRERPFQFLMLRAISAHVLRTVFRFNHLKRSGDVGQNEIAKRRLVISAAACYDFAAPA